MNIVHWLPRYHCAQQFLGDLPAGARVLDVACGEGDLTKFLAERGCRVWGADLLEADIRKGFPRNLDRRVGYAVADINHLPYADGAFDWVFTFGTLQVLPEDAGAIRELTRVVKPGGTLVVCTDVRRPNAGDLFGAQRALRRWLPKFLYTTSRSPVTGRTWLDSTAEDVIYFRDNPLPVLREKFAGFEVMAYDYTLKWFSALTMDVAYGVRGFPRFKLKAPLYWLSSRLDALFCRGPEHPGYSIVVKLRKK
jgi:ubiquinone/menaquinone biosynthesis C-methylase UbiE